MQNLLKKVKIILALGWNSLQKNPEYSLKCTDDIIAWYSKAKRESDYPLIEKLKPLYENAIVLRKLIVLPINKIEI